MAEPSLTGGRRVEGGGRCHVVDGDGGVAAGAGVVVSDGEGHRVAAVVVGREAEVLAGAVGDGLAVAGDHVPHEGVGVGAAGVGEAAAQADQVALVDGLVIAPVDVLGRHVVDGDDRRVLVVAVVLVKDAAEDGEAAVVVEGAGRVVRRVGRGIAGRQVIGAVAVEGVAEAGAGVGARRIGGTAEGDGGRGCPHPPDRRFARVAVGATLSTVTTVEYWV